MPFFIEYKQVAHYEGMAVFCQAERWGLALACVWHFEEGLLDSSHRWNDEVLRCCTDVVGKLVNIANLG